jgi:hypothetical protein
MPPKVPRRPDLGRCTEPPHTRGDRAEVRRAVLGSCPGSGLGPKCNARVSSGVVVVYELLLPSLFALLPALCCRATRGRGLPPIRDVPEGGRRERGTYPRRARRCRCRRERSRPADPCLQVNQPPAAAAIGPGVGVHGAAIGRHVPRLRPVDSRQILRRNYLLSLTNTWTTVRQPAADRKWFVRSTRCPAAHQNRLAATRNRRDPLPPDSSGRDPAPTL